MLIQHTDVSARVLGLRRGAPAGDSPCDATGPTESCGAHDGCCAPGQFCQVASGTQEVVLHVKDIDLSAAVALEEGSAGPPSTAQPVRAYVQLLVVPKGMEPEQGLHYGAAQVRVQEVVLERRADACAALVSAGGG